MRRSGPIRVLIVDRSPFFRCGLRRFLNEQPDIEVVGIAKDAYEARQCIIGERPEIILLDCVLHGVGALVFLERLHEHYPVPVIMISDETPTARQVALDAMEFGALDMISKPAGQQRGNLERLAVELVVKIRSAASTLPALPHLPPPPRPLQPVFAGSGLQPAKCLIAVGASTGGTEAIRSFLAHVPPDFPPIVMVQHMPAGFTEAFANRLHTICPIAVKEAEAGDRLQVGHAYLARGGIQMRVRRDRMGWRIDYGDAEPVNRHCPSVDVLFESVATLVRQHAVGVLLTGMGADGAEGLLHMRQQGAITIAQDHASSVVFGMPKVALELGAADVALSPSEMPAYIVSSLRRRASSLTRAASS
jgi:two-component system chemotaxis response regulator CheB